MIKCLYLLDDEGAVGLYDFLTFGNFDLILKARTPCPVDPTVIATFKSISEHLSDSSESKSSDGSAASLAKPRPSTVKPSNVTHGSRAVPSVDNTGKPGAHSQPKYSPMWVDSPGQWFPLSVIESSAGESGSERAKYQTRAHKATNVVAELRYVNTACDMPVSFTGNNAELEAEDDDLDYPVLGIDDDLCTVDESLATDVFGDDENLLLTSYGAGGSSGAGGVCGQSEFGSSRRYGSFYVKGASSTSPVSSGRGSFSSASSSSHNTLRSMQSISKMKAKSISSAQRSKSSLPSSSPSKKPRQPKEAKETEK